MPPYGVEEFYRIKIPPAKKHLKLVYILMKNDGSSKTYYNTLDDSDYDYVPELDNGPPSFSNIMWRAPLSTSQMRFCCDAKTSLAAHSGMV